MNNGVVLYTLSALLAVVAIVAAGMACSFAYVLVHRAIEWNSRRHARAMAYRNRWKNKACECGCGK